MLMEAALQAMSVREEQLAQAHDTALKATAMRIGRSAQGAIESLQGIEVSTHSLRAQIVSLKDLMEL